MAGTILLVSGIIFSCMIANRFSDRIGMPALIFFMVVGMVFGSEGVFKIPFDNFQMAEQICSIALIFIMFYGGFCTKWTAAKPVLAKAALCSTVGVFLTALLTGLFCYYVLKFNLAGSFLIGAVTSSTDAASVFSILRSKKLNLKDGTASLLEIESGSNDPVSYMLTMIGITLLNHSGISIPVLLISQIIFGIAIGCAVAYIGILLLIHSKIIPQSFEQIFMIGLILLAFGLASLIGGNGYLSVYLMGIILGNRKIHSKIVLVHFFDGITGMAQMVIFFLLGLLASPHKIPEVFFLAVVISLFMVFIARPLTIFLLLKPFKASNKQCLLVSWAGLRGAASIVFAIMVMANELLTFDLFHIVFLIALISVAVQGTFLPLLSKKLDMVDDKSDVRKTFTDYQEEADQTLMRVEIVEGHDWENRRIREVNMPDKSLALIIRRGEKTMIPKGDTLIQSGDDVILSVPSFQENVNVVLDEIMIDRFHKWCNKEICQIPVPKDVLIVMVKRDNETIIPQGSTRIEDGDIVVVCRS